MPHKGFKSLTVPNELHKELKGRAKENHRTIPKEIEHLLKTCPKEA